MPHIALKMDLEENGFDALNGVDPDDVVHLTDDAHVEIGGLTAGMASGKPSIAICAQLPDGKVLVLETSLQLLLAAGDAFKARYGDPLMAEPSPLLGDSSVVTVKLSRRAAAFLHGMAEHLNTVKRLPDTGTTEALQTSAWLEEIAAATQAALDDPARSVLP